MNGKGLCQEIGAGNRLESEFGEIKMELSGELGFYEAGTTKKVGIALTPARGPYLAVFECNGAKGTGNLQYGTGTGTLLGLEGSVIEQVRASYSDPSSGEPHPDYNRMLSEYRTEFKVENGLQAPEQFEGGPKDTLSLVTHPLALKEPSNPPSARQALYDARTPRRGGAHRGGAPAQPAHEVALGFGGLSRDRAGDLLGAALHDPVAGRGLPDGQLLVILHRLHRTPRRSSPVASL